MVARLDCSTKQSVQHGFCRKFNKGIIAMINDNKFEHLSKEDLLKCDSWEYVENKMKNKN